MAAVADMAGDMVGAGADSDFDEIRVQAGAQHGYCAARAGADSIGSATALATAMPSRKALREGRSSLEVLPGSFVTSIAEPSYGSRACAAGALSMMRTGSHAVKADPTLGGRLRILIHGYTPAPALRSAQSLRSKVQSPRGVPRHDGTISEQSVASWAVSAGMR
jgi:hypothetical protein